MDIIKFTCVCVCVCVSVTLSVNSPTGQTPQRIFTFDSLKDADLRKDVPFGGSRWWIITFRGPKSSKPPFWGPECWMGISSLEILCEKCIAIFRSVYQIDMKFDRQLRPATETSLVISYGGKTIPRWLTAAILKIDISPYLSETSFSWNFVHSSRFEVSK